MPGYRYHLYKKNDNGSVCHRFQKLSDLSYHSDRYAFPPSKYTSAKHTHKRMQYKSTINVEDCPGPER